VEASADALERGIATIRRNYASTVRKGKISADEVERRMTLLTGSLTLDDLAACDLIIEAVFEDMAVKQDVFRRLDAIARDGAILATNTSYLDVNAIAAVTRRPEAVIGLHFFSPANVMRLLEVVRGAKTAPSVLATALALGKRLGKVAVPVGVCHGFVGNRMLAARQSEANRLILEGALPWDVDRVLYDFGFPMGPFAMSDLAGLDIGWSRATSQGKSVRDLLCERGRLGQKTGAGFYDYAADRTATPSSETEAIIRQIAAREGVVPRAIGDEEILERCILPMINEGARILDEGIAARGSDIDVVWVHGYGWPVYRGGPMFHADTMGLDVVIKRLDALAAAHGPRFEAALLLRSCAKEQMPLSRYGKA
jgi:3-hydroxyacyl-CoA dehydrogenase